MFRFQHAAMATLFAIRCTYDDEAYAEQAARFAFAEVDRLEQQFSRFVENSDISRINHLAAGEDTRVAVETFHCLKLARLAWEHTSGAFDPSIGSGFEQLELVEGEFVVRVPADVRPTSAGAQQVAPLPATSDFRPMGLDAGAIGKGYAVDRIAEALEDWDVTAALVDAGFSSVLALEPPAGHDEWPLTLGVPGEATPLVRIGARQRVLGASGIRKGDHIRDPRTGMPVRGRDAAWVSAPRGVMGDISRPAGAQASPAALADALSTAFMITPLDDIERYCQAHPGIEAWILANGVVQRVGAQELGR